MIASFFSRVASCSLTSFEAILLCIVLIIVVALFLYAFMLDTLVDRSTFARGFTKTPEEMQDRLSEEAKRFIKDKMNELKQAQKDGIGDGKIYDTHCHLVGIGTGDSGCYFATQKASFFQIVKRIKYAGFVSAAGLAYSFTKKVIPSHPCHINSIVN